MICGKCLQWKLEGYHVENYGSAHYWNECAGEGYYVDITSARKVVFQNELKQGDR